VKDKNRIFTEYQMFVTEENLLFHRCLYNKSQYFPSISNDTVAYILHITKARFKCNICCSKPTINSLQWTTFKFPWANYNICYLWSVGFMKLVTETGTKNNLWSSIFHYCISLKAICLPCFLKLIQDFCSLQKTVQIIYVVVFLHKKEEVLKTVS